MAMLCPVWTEKTVNAADQLIVDPKTGAKTQLRKPVKKVLICGCKVAGYVRVTYSQMVQWNASSTKADDVFGLCAEHFATMSRDATAWNRTVQKYRAGRSASGLRGIVGSVEVVEGVADAVAANDKVRRAMDAVKADFKRKMRQSNTRCLSVDDWRRLMDECVEEWIVEDVMNS